MTKKQRKYIVLLSLLLSIMVLQTIIIILILEKPETERDKSISKIQEKPAFKVKPIVKPEPKFEPKPKPVIKASLVISPDKKKYIKAPEAGYFIIKVKSNTTWTVNSNNDWLRLEPSAGDKSIKTVKAHYSTNIRTNERSAVITFIPAGADEKTILVTQKGVPIKAVKPTIPLVSTGRALSVSEDAIAVSGNIDDPGDGYDSVSQHGHCWSEATNEPTINENKTELGRSSQKGSFISKLSDLEAFKTYYIRAYAVNQTGIGYGDTIELSTQITDGLIACYPFDGNAEDKSGYGLHGRLHGGVSLTKDRYGKDNSAYMFDGSNPYLSVGDYFDNTSTLAFSFWVYIDTSSTVPFISKYDTTTNLWGYYIDCMNNKIGIGVRDNYNVLTARTSNVSLPKKKWTHITGIFDLTQTNVEDRLKIYCNGIAQELSYSSSSNIKKIPDIKLPFNIGTYIFSSRTRLYFKGILDELTIYSRVLNEDEIRSIYNRERHTRLINPGVPEVAGGKTYKLTNRTALISGNINSFGRTYSEVTEHGHCWSSDSTLPTVNESEKTKLGKTDKRDEFLSRITGLKPFTKYYIRAYATNEIGTNYGKTQEFVTLYNPYITVTQPAEWSIETNPDILWLTISDVKEQKTLFSINPFYETLGVYIAGNYAYSIENKTTGLRIIDLSAPFTPSLSGFLDISDTVLNLDFQEGVVYILTVKLVDHDPNNKGTRQKYYKLVKIDVSNPAMPYISQTNIITNITEVKPTSLHIKGNLAYVTISPDLYIIDTSGISKPPHTSLRCSPDGALDVYLEGDYAYLADGSGGLRIINISDPKNSKISAVLNIPGRARSVYVSKHYAYIAAGNSGLHLIDISDPKRPFLCASMETPYSVCSVFVSGNYAYVAGGESGLQVIDVSDPRAPKQAGEYSTPGYAYEVRMAGHYAYIADGTGGLQVLDLGPFYQGARSYYNYKVNLFAIPNGK